MKKNLLALVVFIFMISSSHAQLVVIPDPNFGIYLHDYVVPTCTSYNTGSGEWQLDTTCSALAAVKRLDFSTHSPVYYLSSLDGLNYLYNLEAITFTSFMPGLPALTPPHLQYINMSYLNIVAIPTLPASVDTFIAETNNINGQQIVSPTLRYLDLSENLIGGVTLYPVTFDSVPNTMTDLIMNNTTNFYGLQRLPDSLRTYNVAHTSTSSLPTLSQHLKSLNISYTTISCLPAMPSLTYFNFTSTYIGCMPNRFLCQSFAPSNPLSMALCTPSTVGCDYYYAINGTAHLDTTLTCNEDLLQQGDLLSGVKILLDLNGRMVKQTYTSVYGYGKYSFKADSTGSYTIMPDTTDPVLQVVCPASDSRTVGVANIDTTIWGQDFGLKCRGVDNGVSAITGRFGNGSVSTVHIVAGDMGRRYGLTCSNHSSGTVITTISGPCTFDSAASYARTPDSISPQRLVYYISDFNSVNPGDFDILVTTQAHAHPTNTVCISTSVVTTGGDISAADDNLTECFAVDSGRTSATNFHFTANAKKVYPDTITGSGGWLTYTVYFQNVGSSAAGTVIVRDTLSSYLDASTFQYLNASTSTPPLVEVSGPRIAITLEAINLPDSATGQDASRGWVQFRVKSLPGLSPPLSIINRAGVYYDAGAVQRTNTVTTYLVPYTCHNIYDTIATGICSGDSVRIGTHTYRSTGTSTDTLLTAAGCDSIVTLHLTLNSPVTDSVSITISQATILAGAADTFTAIPSNGGPSPAYQWYENASPVGINSPQYISTTLFDQDQVYVIMTTSAACASPVTAYSNTIFVNVNAPLSAGPDQTVPVFSTVNMAGIGYGSWSAGPANPAPVVIGSTNDPNTDIYNFTMAGVYAFIYSDGTTSDTMTVTVTVPANYVLIPDPNFGNYLNNNGISGCLIFGGNYPFVWYMDTTCAAVLAASSFTCSSLSIADVTGVQYFENLSSFTCSQNQITFISGLPASLTYLDCQSNQITSLPALLPSGLTSFECSLNSLTSLPAIPSGVTYFDCLNNQLASLPALPAGITYIGCAGNLLTSLPALPDSLLTIYAGYNRLTSLPALPAGLQSINLSNNLLTTLPALPPALWALDCSYNSVTSLPLLPSTLMGYLYVNHNLNLSCLNGVIQNGIMINIDSTAISCVPDYVSYSNMGSVNPNSLPLCQPGGSCTSYITNAGPDQIICVNSTATMAGTGANTGYWSQDVNNPVLVSYTHDSLLTTTVTGFTAPGVYVLLYNNDVLWVSDTMIVTVTSLVAPSVSITAAHATINAGATDTFTAAPMNGGASPSYQWYKNGATVGINSSTYITNTLANNDSVWCVMTSNSACASPTTAASNHIHITVNTVTCINAYTTITDSICSGASVTIGTHVHNTTGITIDTLLTSGGCDSIVTLHLMVHPNSTSSITRTICQGSSYLGRTATGTYVDTLTGASGCDSIRTLHLTVNAISTSSITQTICQGSSYLGRTATGTYVDTLTGASGCDSIRTLHLTVNPISSSTITQSICQGSSYTFGGHNLSASGTYADTLTGSNGCDSVVTLHLTVRTDPTHTVTITISSGQSYTVGADTFSATGTYVVTLTGAGTNGCDSIVTLNLTVSGGTGTQCTPSVSIAASSTSACTSGTFTATPANGGTGPTYQWYKNNVAVGTNSVTYTAATLNYNDSVWVKITATPCGTVKTALSNRIKITGPAGSVPSVIVTANNTNLNIAGSIILTATPVNAGTSPHYAWYHNGGLISGATSSVLSYGGSLGSGDQIYCTLTTTSCGSAQTVFSDTVIFTKTGSAEKNITEFIMPDQIGTSVIDTVAATISAVVSLLPAQRTAIHPVHILVSTGATYGPSEANNENFSLPVTYTVTAQNGSTRVWTATVVDGAGMNLEADSSSTEPVIEGLILYPNPASTYITAMMQGGMEPAVVTILDLTGRVMYNQQLPPSGTINHQIDVSEYAAGNYIVIVAVGEKSDTKKFTVLRQ